MTVKDQIKQMLRETGERSRGRRRDFEDLRLWKIIKDIDKDLPGTLDLLCGPCQSRAVKP